ncbi:hypothetical protein ACQPYA_30030 [Micromonospora sp. CA-263727]|uniref:hypothetical protein n=1 Tax=Micromonospora sp. CA-263727 TaxID=3239967 RepID=UPI003D94FD15
MGETGSGRYRYTARDLERVPPGRVRVGDLIASAGPPGSGRFSADRVTAVWWAGKDRFRPVDTWRIEYGAGRYFVNPDTMPVYRVRVPA